MERAGTTEYLFELEASQPLISNSQKPSWFNPYQQVVLTDSESWSDVVEWALPLYADAISERKEVLAVANTIASEFQTKDEQIRAALAFVQNEVRYLGLEMGANSHKPSSADETLARRYGDCKDKAVLLISLLKALNIDGHPALVSTDRRHQLLEHPPTAYAFDHVIVRVEREGGPLWLDPTRQHQKGALDKIAQSDYGYALVVKPGVRALKAMDVDPIGQVEVTDEFDLSGGLEAPGSFTTTTRYTGFEAERMRYTLSRQSIESLSTDYLNFYKRRYAELEAAKPMKVNEEDGGAAVTVSEYYTLANAWDTGENGRKEFNAHANMAYDALVQVDERQRNAPLNLPHPHRVSQQITIRLYDGDWDIRDADFVETNDYFTYRTRADFNEKTNLLQLRYEYTSHRDHVPVSGIDDYIAAYGRAEQDTGYYLYVSPTVGGEEFDPFLVGMFALLAFYVAAVVVVWIIARKRLREQSGESAFHPVALPKFIILSAATFGIYPYYWMYGAWRHIKSHDNTDILPFLRTFFSLFWFHSLAERIIVGKESSERGPLPKSTMLVAVLTIVYIISLLIQNVDDGVWMILATATTTAILVLLVYHVNRLPVNQGEQRANNSRIGGRHLVLLLMCAPLWFLTVGTEARLIPSTKVVEGDTLLWRDIRFMQRAELLDANEKLLWFYSDAFLDGTKDGNALTDRGVFSYWKDESGALHTEMAVFKDIVSFELNSETSWEGVATLSVHRHDGSDFLLYLSTEEGGHNEFYNELKTRWEAVQRDL